MRLQALSAFIAIIAPIVVVSSAACVGDDPASAPLGAAADAGGTLPGQGETCSAADPCPNSTPCVDGFCCDSACTGTCEACDVAGQEGHCAAVKGAPRHGACEGDPSGKCAGSCDGTKRALCTYPEVTCGAGSCAGAVATLPATCKAGSCAKADTQTCALGCFEEGCLGVKQVAAGYYTTCAVLTDKKVRCWGSNDSGQAGQNGVAVVTTPTEVHNLANVEMVAATFGSMCFLLADKTVKCIGGNAQGQLGLGSGDGAPHPSPAAVAGLTDVVFIGGSSGGHFCAITTSGAVKCWGGNGSGQLGDGSTGAFKASPVTVCQPGESPCKASSGATFVAGGDNHTCAVFAGGKVACWGGNSQGQLGRAAGAAQLVPQFVTPDVTGATFLTAGNQTSCAVAAGAAKCWGSNGLGVLGHGTVGGTGDPVPKAVCTKEDCSATLTGVTGVATYDESACALAGGAVKCWGTNTGGQLGDGNTTASQSYAASTAIATGAVYVTSGGQVNYAIVVDRANRDLRCWGNESNSQCATGTPDAVRKTPVAPKW